MARRSDSELEEAMARLADGDRRALPFVFDALDGPVRALAHKLLGAGPDAEDAAQDALLEVFASIDRYERGRSPITWALTITGWQCRTVRRRQSRSRTIASTHEPLSGADSPEEDAMRDELRRAIVAVAGTLSPIDHETLEAMLNESGEGPTFRKRKARLLDRLRDGLRRVYG